jgi:integrase
VGFFVYNAAELGCNVVTYLLPSYVVNMRDSQALEVRNLVFASGERFPILVDTKTGIPDFESTLYLLTQLRARNLASATLRSALRGIRFGYQVLHLIGVDFDQRIKADRMFEVGELDRLVNYFSKTQERITGELEEKQGQAKPKVIRRLESVRMKSTVRNGEVGVQGDTAAIRLLYFRDFLEWKVKAKIHSPAIDSAGRIALGQDLEFTLNAINARMPSGSTREPPQGLSAQEIEALHESIEMDSQFNPWKAESIRVRNRLIVQLLLNLGLRKGELCGLKVEDINFRANELTVHRRADDVDDPRPVQPNAKTKARVLALDAELSRGLHLYVVNNRNKLRGSRFHPFLFVANGTGIHYHYRQSTVFSMISRQ